MARVALTDDSGALYGAVNTWLGGAYAGKTANGYNGSPVIVQDPTLTPAEIDNRPLAIPYRAPGPDKPVGDASRRNIWQYTEEVGANRYSTNSTYLPKSTDTIVRDGITMTRLTSSNFYAALTSAMSSLGIAPFVTGKRYMLSYYILARTTADRFFWMRDLGLSTTYGHGPRLLEPNETRRVWTIQQATDPSRLRGVTVPSQGFDTGVGGNPTWYMQGNQADLSTVFDIYVGGFQIEQIADTAVDGIAGIGDSTMQGASGGTDHPASREWMGYLAGLLNVNTYNRGVGGERTDAMDARWATDITPLKGVSKYVIIQGGINDVAQDRPIADIQASISSMHGKALTDGFVPVMLTCTPTASIGNNPTREAARVELNTWLKQTFPNVIDIAAVIEDPLDPRFIRRTPGGADGWYGDGVHYRQAAKRAVAEKIAAWRGWEFPTPSPYQKVVGEVFTQQGGVVLVAPDGSRHRLAVDNMGALTTTPA